MRRVRFAAQPPLNGTIPYGGLGTKIKKSPKVKIGNKSIKSPTITQKKKPHISFSA